MTTLQRFKTNDATETSMILCAMPTLEDIGDELDAFFEEAYECFLLGDVLFELGRDPMAGVITQETFRSSFPAIHELFTRPGTFEFYLDVIRSIWGSGVDVEFVIPSPGVLQINVLEFDTDSFSLQLREIEDDEYVYSNLIDQDGDLILVRSPIGIKTQSELDALIAELSVYGVYTTASLA